MSTPRSLVPADGVERIDVVVGERSWAALRATPRGQQEAAATDDAAPADLGTVLLFHGFNGSKEDFLLLLPELAQRGWTALALDHRGQHESPHDGSALGMDDFADDIIQIAASLHPASVHVVGHSFGGLAARRAALTEPAALNSLTLLNSGPAALTSTDQAQALNAFIAAMRMGMVDAVWAHIEAERRAADPTLSDEVVRFVEQRLRNGHLESHTAMAQALLEEIDHVEALAQTGLPVHVAFGVDDDIWPDTVQHDMAQRLGAVATPIPGAGHSPAVDDPTATADALHAWWISHGGA